MTLQYTTQGKMSDRSS